MKHQSFILPEVGTKVTGVHILGKSYNGKICSLRPHTLNWDLIEFFIELDEPLNFSNCIQEDIRTHLNFTGSIERSNMREGRWVGPSGDYFSLITLTETRSLTGQ
jgi:hypothetical protein